MKSRLALTGIDAGKTAIGPYALDGIRELPDQRLQDALAIDRLGGKQSTGLFFMADSVWQART